MRALSIFQILLFLAVTFYLVYSKLILTEYVFFGLIFGLIIHWSLTNKGNKNIINIRPLGSGFRVLFYDVYLSTLIIKGLLEGFNHEIMFLMAILVGLIVIDYFDEG